MAREQREGSQKGFPILLDCRGRLQGPTLVRWVRGCGVVVKEKL